MTYEDFRDHCISLIIHKMTRPAAENLVDWIFPKEYKASYEDKLAESDEFIKYVEKVLGE